MSKEATAQLNTFKDSALAIATEDLRYKAEMKPLKAQLENILANRQNDLNNGLSVEEVAANFHALKLTMLFVRLKLHTMPSLNH